LTLEILNIVSVIIQIILFAALIYVVISLTKYVKQLMVRVDVLQDDLQKFKSSVDPLIDDTRTMIQKINKVSDKVDENFVYVTKTLEKLGNATDDIINFKDRILRRAEPPIFDTISAFAGIVKGIKVFTDTWKSNKTVRTHHVDEDNLLFDTNSESDFELEREYDDINKELNEVRKKLEEMKRV
jgi:uncharacterized protein YlxW (UPF0749 family)